jgi:hypothetical protein
VAHAERKSKMNMAKRQKAENFECPCMVASKLLCSLFARGCATILQQKAKGQGIKKPFCEKIPPQKIGYIRF